MTKKLIIVESPTKIKTLRKFLGKDYAFESSVGHIRDLPAKRFGIDVEHDFTPEYEILENKQDVIDKLEKAARSCDEVILSPDPDREGEAIAWHIVSILPKKTKYKRVTFNEYTKKAVLEALEHPRPINEDLVNAQQARRLLDRMVGYKISPILHRKIHRGHKLGSLSAGRVQSVVLKLIVDREKEIDAFIPVEYWNLGALLQSKKGESKPFTAALYSVSGKKVEKEDTGKGDCTLINNEASAKKIKEKLDKAKYTVSKIEKREKKRNPTPPFITSTLQQEAARHYGFSSSKTMSIAQSLYEGVDLGDHGPEGLITYMRTDSTRTSPDAEADARELIKSQYGPNYLPPTPPKYATKKNAQDAHEAIRPTNLAHTPDSIRDHLTREQQKLYLLIWQRFIASQMQPAIYDTVSVTIETDQDLILRASGSVIKFAGFLAVYEEKEDHDDKEEKENLLPQLAEGEVLKHIESTSTQSFTKAPPRFTEASLVKELEKSGIGRPSTYATIMQKILNRSYTTKEKSALKPTELGKIICQMLEENFPKIMNIAFTAEMENELDKIAETDIDWKAFLKAFWKDFLPTVEHAEKEAKVPKIMTEHICPTCGSHLQKIWARDRYFLGCSTYPDCKYTAPLEEVTLNKEDYDPTFDWDQKCPKCTSDMKIRQSRYGIFLGCSKYPECKTIVNIPKKGEIANEDLPACPATGCPGQITKKRSRFGKYFYSCSTFPECSVIANSVEDLLEKYKGQPRTAYVSKRPPKGEKAAKGKEKTATKKASSSKGKASKTKAKTTKKKESAPRQQALYTPSPVLAKIVGEAAISRPEATKKIWDYIKANKLQDPKNKRLIITDSKLEKFFGHKEKTDMMKLAGYLSKHLS
ncbi:MAG: type I DNA topoisomerase [Verrucomicrobia bacterium]|nr:type I DNA topoisomerase [Verrucomicrobiota bacterium]